MCGFGTCTNNPNGEFYMCECEDGAVLGTNSDNLPTCFGMKAVKRQLDLDYNNV